MHLVGIPATVLLQIGVGLGAAVVVLYVLKLRRRPIAVPFAQLWQRILRDQEATTLFSQLKRILSLLLQLALLALLLLAIGDPRSAVSATEGRHLVVLIDASASMQAEDVPDESAGAAGAEGQEPVSTRLDLAKRRVRELIRGLSGQDRMLIAQMDAAITPHSTMTSDVAELEDALARVRATDAAAHFARGLRFAVDSLRGLSNPEIVVASDGALPPPVDDAGEVALGDAKLSFIGVGSSERNVAITGFSVRRYPLDKSRYEVLLAVTNTSDEAEQVALELYGDQELTDIVQLRLGPRETLSRFYPNLSGASETLEARIRLADGGRDDLAVDDHAYALLPERRRARVQVVSRGNMYLEAALLLDEYLEVTTVAPADYPAAGRYDVTIFDDVAPPVRDGSGHVLYLNPTGDDLPFKVKERVESDRRYTVGFDEIDDKSPLMRHVSLGDVNVAAAYVLEGSKRDKVVGRSFKGPLLIHGRRQGRKFVALGFDVRDSDLPLRIAWPLLVLNTVNFFIEEDTGYISSFQTGQVWNIPAPSAAETATLLLPAGERRVVSVKDGRAVFLGQHTGFYALEVGDGGDDERTAFAANMVDPAESSIAPRTELRVGERQAGEVEGFVVGVRREVWIYLLALVLLVTALEWLTYHRRVTV
ncbi:MAG: VWA domain-containing protein [Deltaproteobacteria bacterium]|jgi:hypothetical protein|nr:VWA domain-containing protein [Deltaproteobacteria bacterium]MBW2534729.1 VWA domain-containing protein [Deltaproteobacteria bacterium]